MMLPRPARIVKKTRGFPSASIRTPPVPRCPVFLVCGPSVDPSTNPCTHTGRRDTLFARIEDVQSRFREEFKLIHASVISKKPKLCVFQSGAFRGCKLVAGKEACPEGAESTTILEVARWIQAKNSQNISGLSQ